MLRVRVASITVLAALGIVLGATPGAFARGPTQWASPRPGGRIGAPSLGALDTDGPMSAF